MNKEEQLKNSNALLESRGQAPNDREKRRLKNFEQIKKGEIPDMCKPAYEKGRQEKEQEILKIIKNLTTTEYNGLVLTREILETKELLEQIRGEKYEINL